MTAWLTQLVQVDMTDPCPLAIEPPGDRATEELQSQRSEDQARELADRRGDKDEGDARQARSKVETAPGDDVERGEQHRGGQEQGAQRAAALSTVLDLPGLEARLLRVVARELGEQPIDCAYGPCHLVRSSRSTAT